MKRSFLDVKKNYFLMQLFWQIVVQLEVLRDLTKLLFPGQAQLRWNQKMVCLKVAGILHGVLVKQVKMFKKHTHHYPVIYYLKVINQWTDSQTTPVLYLTLHHKTLDTFLLKVLRREWLIKVYLCQCCKNNMHYPKWLSWIFLNIIFIFSTFNVLGKKKQFFYLFNL